ncbi:MAG: Ig-like domain-containing protein, partial [Clostridiales bacterium]|nr:Ig-like domain-containing protein [Clostridiales bacterium]
QYKKFQTQNSNYEREIAFYAQTWQELCALRDNFRYYDSTRYFDSSTTEGYYQSGPGLHGSVHYRSMMPQVKAEIGDTSSVEGREAAQAKARKIAADITAFLDEETRLIDILHDTENRAALEKQAAQAILGSVTNGTAAGENNMFVQALGVSDPTKFSPAGFHNSPFYEEDQPTLYLQELRAICLGQSENFFVLESVIDDLYNNFGKWQQKVKTTEGRNELQALYNTHITPTNLYDQTTYHLLTDSPEELRCYNPKAVAMVNGYTADQYEKGPYFLCLYNRLIYDGNAGVPEHIAVTGVSVTPSPASVAIGGTLQLSAAVSPANASTGGAAWVSGDHSVASVSQDGLVTGNAPGEAVVYAISLDNDEIFGQATITVTGTIPIWRVTYKIGSQVYDTSDVPRAWGFLDAIPQDPELAGYIFRGWYLDALFTRGFSSDTPVNSNITVYGKMEKLAAPGGHDYTLWLDGADGTLRKNGPGGDDLTAEMAGAGAVVGGSPGARVLAISGFSFITSALCALEVPAGTAITLAGDSIVSSTFSGPGPSSGIRSSGGALTINGSGSLFALGGMGSESAGLGGIDAGGVVIGGGADVTAMGAYGVCTDGPASILVSGDAVFTAVGRICAFYDSTGGSGGSGGGGGSGDPGSFTVPLGYEYALSENMSALDPETGISDGSILVGPACKYARISAGKTYTLYLDDADGKLRKDGPGGDDLTAAMGSSAVVSGSVGAWRLTLSGFSFITSAQRALELPGGTTVELSGTNTIMSMYGGAGFSAGVYSAGGLYITGNGSLKASGGPSGAGGESYGIYTEGGAIEIGGGSVTATGGTCALRSGPGENYTAPEWYKYRVADNIGGVEPLGGISGGMFDVTPEYKYAWIEYAAGDTAEPIDAETPAGALGLTPGHVMLTNSEGSKSAVFCLSGNSLITNYNDVQWSVEGLIDLGSGRWGTGAGEVLRITNLGGGMAEVSVAAEGFSAARAYRLWAVYGGYSASATLEILPAVPMASSGTCVKALSASVAVNRAREQGTLVPIAITQDPATIRLLSGGPLEAGSGQGAAGGGQGTTGVGAMRLVTGGGGASPKGLENFSVSIWPSDNRYIEIKALNSKAVSVNKVSLQILPLGTEAPDLADFLPLNTTARRNAWNAAWNDAALDKIEATGTFGIKVSSSYPKVKIKAADLNLAFPTVAMPIKVTCAGGGAVELLDIDSALKKKVQLNRKNSSLSLVQAGGKPVQGKKVTLSGKLTLKQDGYYEQKLSFKVKVVAPAMPKVKLARNTVSLYFTAVPETEAGVINAGDLKPALLTLKPGVKGAVLEDWYAIKGVVSNNKDLKAEYKGGGIIEVTPLSAGVPKKVTLKVIFRDPRDYESDGLSRNLTLNVSMVKASKLKPSNKATTVKINKDDKAGQSRDIPVSVNVGNLALADWEVLDGIVTPDLKTRAPSWYGDDWIASEDWAGAILIENAGSAVSVKVADEARLANLIKRHNSFPSGNNIKYTMKISSPKLNESAGKKVAFKLTLDIVKSAAGIKLTVDKKAKLDIADQGSAARVKVGLTGTASGIADVVLYESRGKTASAEPDVVYTKLEPVFTPGALSFDIVRKDNALAPGVNNNLSVWVKLENGQELTTWSKGKQNGKTVYNDKFITIKPVQTVQKGWKAGATLYRAQPLAGSPISGVTLTKPANVTVGEVQLNMKKLKALRFAIEVSESEAKDAFGALNPGYREIVVTKNGIKTYSWYRQVDGFEVRQNGPSEWTVYFKDGACPEKVFSSDYKKVSNLKSSYKADLQIWAEGTYQTDGLGKPLRDAGGDILPLGTWNAAGTKFTAKAKPTVITVTVGIR